MYFCIKYSMCDLICDVISAVFELRYESNQCIW